MMAALDKVDASSAADATNTNTKSIKIKQPVIWHSSLCQILVIIIS